MRQIWRDALGQLLTETVTKDGVTTVVNTMTYDNYGNILTNNGKVYTYGDLAWKDKLTAFDGQAITYDAQGNPLSYLGHTLTWEKGRQLKSFDSYSYTYNANGIRTSKTVDGKLHTYTLDGTKILRETWSEDNIPRVIVPMYDNEDSVCGIIYNNRPFYFVKNLQGDVIAIADDLANIVARYSYDAWGVPTIVQDTTIDAVYSNGTESVGYTFDIAEINPYRYRSYYYDSEIGCYYLQSRYYNPSIGRFVNADEVRIVVSENDNTLLHNSFSYCKNEPILECDIVGTLAAKLIARIIIGIVIGYCIQVFSDLITYWYRKIFYGSDFMYLNGADYVSSMISWALTCVSFSSKVVEIIAMLLPIVIKQVWKVFNNSFDWGDLIIDLLFALVSYIITKVLGRTAKNRLNKIIKKAGNGNSAYNKIRISEKRLNMKMEVWGMQFNLALNVSNFFVSCFYNLASVKNNW